MNQIHTVAEQATDEVPLRPLGNEPPGVTHNSAAVQWKR